MNLIFYWQVQVNAIISSCKMSMKNLHKCMSPKTVSLFHMTKSFLDSLQHVPTPSLQL
jgi:hypothetical protein